MVSFIGGAARERLAYPQHVDVAIVGAGISGIAAAVELSRSLPEKSMLILDMRESAGGTWDLFRFPGIRSDSDMHTLGFSFRPWPRREGIAAGAQILEYLLETIEEFSLAPLIKFSHTVTRADWDSMTSTWRLTISAAGTTKTVTCTHLYLGAGYYRHAQGFNPALPGEASFLGPIVHPQHWPADLDLTGRKVAVIGSGATAITLVPNLAKEASQVTMIQRSPGYVDVTPLGDPEADELRARLSPEEAFKRIRTRNLERQQERYALARAYPEATKQELFAPIEALLGEDMRKAHFTPSYEPWDERVCFAPNGDIIQAIHDGTANIITGTIDVISPTGVRMRDGQTVEADVLVKATGLTLNVAGGIQLYVDGQRTPLDESFTYKGMGFSGVPNLFHAFGFLHSSWTLRIELVNEYWADILRHMDTIGAQRVTPTLRPQDADMQGRPFITAMQSGYLRRGIGRMPRQGTVPWEFPQNWDETLSLFAVPPADDDALVFASDG